MHPDKTRLLPFGRPDPGPDGGKGAASFDFLGFTHYWRRTRWGRYKPSLKTRKASLRRAIQSITDWCRCHRHEPVKEQHAALKRRIVGHGNYFGVNGNHRSVALVVQHAERAWHKWLCRRSQRAYLNWERFTDLLRDYPLPVPPIRIQIWDPSA